MPLEKLAIFILVVVTTTTSASRPGTTDDAEKLAKDEEERLAKMVEWSKTTTPPSDIVAPLPGGPISCTAACMDICMVLEPPSEHVYELAYEFGCAQDHIEELDVVIQGFSAWVGERKELYDHEDSYSRLWERKSMTMRQFIQALGRHMGKEKVNLDDLFLLHSMDGGVSVDVPWHVAKFLCDKSKGSKRKSPIVGAYLIGKIASYHGLMTLGSLMNVTLGPETSSMSVAKLVDLGICRYNDLGIGEMVAEIPEVAANDDVGAGHAEIGGVRRHPNKSNANRLRAMNERL
ncbi:hypothetical protein Tco_0459605 [Tanacetum coccineum]